MRSTEQMLGQGDVAPDGFAIETEPGTKSAPPPSWLEWCERNSKPLIRTVTPVRRKLTRWQKRGPMSKKDWKHFSAWAATRAMPRELPEIEPTPLPCAARYLPCAKWGKKPLDPDEREEKLEALSMPRTITEKYTKIYDPPAYSPAIVWGRPPHRDPGRPFKPPFVPQCFPNDDIEGDFWAQMRFPIRPAALLGSATPRIVSLAKPRQYPPIPHCILPKTRLDPLDERPPPRKKFTPREWRHHQIRLMYLSKPITRPTYDFYYYMA
ncbi:uncharacterized protein Dana_GF19945 [Drosophila ananassae]|uniref:Uncharacterized protein n=1 Tax=Drosophila ananassae TaxID=7217 RepID=B3M2D6_DROAN|nr:uncharacterized protein LOC6502680 [Drosophila ananassae]XP_032305909.1 uncharacterized protein LOC6502680 [Drosophila ananassae]EDV43389.1 uncharacterized protein Dana_GF19945 [Drosophila ananassae]